MTINDQWMNTEGQPDKDLSALLNMSVISRLPSMDPVAKLRRVLLMNLVWGLLIGLGYLVIMIRQSFWPIKGCFGFLCLFTLLTLVKGLGVYREMRNRVAFPSVLEEMERHYRNIKQWISLQQLIALVSYVVSLPGAFLLGYSFGSGKRVDQIVLSRGTIIGFLILMAILAPVCVYLTRWMCRKSFGQYAEQLKENIESLKYEK